ncbi:hypothetical protein B9Q20_11015 [Enterobacter mori]|uniref:DUF262 domain-containing protein n=1 Tax=Enterobacter mori TaxID=539813 RepID=UPI000C1E2487|nr:DUF262 domain-containing protein [Enterobacter mori]PJD08374.1 hypothetical protein B9Q20_11015 [Enterobacter mori]
MEYQLSRFRIDFLNDLILSGQLGLPDFQRDFVWGPSKTTDLLQSIAREWPVGSLLILDGPIEFASKPIELGPDTNEDKLRYYLLDGQQRITSIYHAINDLSENIYYIDLKILMENSLDEDFIFHLKRNRFEKIYKNPKEMADDRIIKICDIYETESFIEWLGHISESDARKEITKIRRNYLYGLNSGVFNIPATVLPKDVDFSALAKIFEGMNTNSVRLTTSDLLVAANLPRGVNLRQMWRELIISNPSLSLLDIELLDVLKICALLERNIDRKSASGLKQSDLIRISPLVYKKNWGNACSLINKATEYALNNLGLLNKSFLPSSSNLIALSIVLNEVTSNEIILCLWCQWIFEETFSQSSHTRLLTELSEKRKNDWGSLNITDLSNKFSEEINLILNKNCGSNAYLLRGISSIRAALAMKSSESEQKSFLDNRDKVEIYNILSGMSPKKDDLIIDTRVGIRSIKNGKISTSTLDEQANITNNLCQSLEIITSKRN